MKYTLLIGPGLNKDRTNLGGATRSYENLIKYYREQGIPHKEMYTHRLRFPRPLYLLVQFFRFIWGAHTVFMNLSQNGTRFLGPFICICAVLFRRKVVVRPFGSSMKEIYLKARGPEKWLLKNTVLKADILYLQTEELIRIFRPLSRNVLQLKTSRKRPSPAFTQNKAVFNKRFLFIGQIKPTKGIDEITKVIAQLGPGFCLDVYGPIVHPQYEQIENYSWYKGALIKENQLYTTLANYDVLILPSYYSGEGYPGVIVEAYSMGMPVIATYWRSIPEIVRDNETGFLITPRSAESLEEAILNFNEVNYQRMSANALSYYLDNFRSDLVMAKMVREIAELRTDQKMVDNIENVCVKNVEP